MNKDTTTHPDIEETTEELEFIVEDDEPTLEEWKKSRLRKLIENAAKEDNEDSNSSDTKDGKTSVNSITHADVVSQCYAAESYDNHPNLGEFSKLVQTLNEVYERTPQPNM